MQALTEDEFKAALPPEVKKNINPALIMKINNTLKNEEEWESYRENLLSYTHVLQKGKFKMEQYLNAVRYVGFKVMGHTNKDAYIKTFPKKYNGFIQSGVTAKDISSYTTAYNKSKLVNLIFEQTLVPVHILNAPVLQEAINVQISIMKDEEVSPKVRSDAANSLMTHLKGPETKRVELDIAVDAGDTINVYKQAMGQFVEAQMALAAEGGDLKAITNAPIKPKDRQEAIDI